MLALVSCNVFLRIGYLVKFVYMLVGLLVFNVMFYSVFFHVFEIYDLFTRYVRAAFVSRPSKCGRVMYVIMLDLYIIGVFLVKTIRLWSIMATPGATNGYY